MYIRNYVYTCTYFVLMTHRGESCSGSYSTYATCHDDNSNCDTEERSVYTCKLIVLLEYLC